MDHRTRDREGILSEERHTQDIGSTIGGIRDTDEGVTEVSLPVCGTCGRVLADRSFGFCFSCGNKVCNDCAVAYRRRTHCPACTLNILQIERLDYKVLLVLKAGFRKNRDIAKLAGATRREVKQSWNRIWDLGYFTKEGITRRIVLPAKTSEVILACNQIFGKDLDVIELDARLQKGVHHV